VPAATVHLKPTAALAPRVLLPGDPGRALLIAQRVLHEPRMFNHHRGLWGYTGEASDGELLSVQSTGMGGASTAIVVEELARLGARRLVRVGTCGALARDLDLGQLLVAEEALAQDGASQALGAGQRVRGDAALTTALRGAIAPGLPSGAVASTDLFYDTDLRRGTAWRDAGAIAVEMEAATLFRLGELRGLQTACLLAVSDLAGDEHLRATEEQIEDMGARLGEVAARALTGA
jgi:DeoD family purine-nucleoside phosphorylase